MDNVEHSGILIHQTMSVQFPCKPGHGLFLSRNEVASLAAAGLNDLPGVGGSKEEYHEWETVSKGKQSKKSSAPSSEVVHAVSSPKFGNVQPSGPCRPLTQHPLPPRFPPQHSFSPIGTISSGYGNQAFQPQFVGPYQQNEFVINLHQKVMTFLDNKEVTGTILWLGVPHGQIAQFAGILLVRVFFLSA